MGTIGLSWRATLKQNGETWCRRIVFCRGTQRIGPSLSHGSCRVVVKLARIALLLRIDPRCGPRASPNYEVWFDDDFFGVGLL